MEEATPLMTEEEAAHLEALYEAFAAVGKGLAARPRLVLLELIAQGPKTVDELSQQSGLATGSASQHLQKLAASGLVQGKRKGRFVEYSVTGVEVIQLLAMLRAVAERHNLAAKTAARRLNDLSEAEILTARELRSRMRDGAVTLIDVRSTKEFEAGHISGATSIPLAELEERIRDQPLQGMAIAYCSGPYCFTARRAVELLNEFGVESARLDCGYHLWKYPLRLPS